MKKNNMFVTIEKVLNLGHGGEGGREREERRRGEKRKEKREREAGIKRRKGRDNFLNPHIFIPSHAFL